MRKIIKGMRGDCMASFLKLTQNDIKEGMRFSAPVFFDDGKNMFLAAGRPAKPYHLAALKNWNVPFLLTVGHVLSQAEIDAQANANLEDVDELEPVDDDMPVNI